MKHVPTMHISINSTNGEKKIPVCYLVDKQCAYIPEATYKNTKMSLIVISRVKAMINLLCLH